MLKQWLHSVFGPSSKFVAGDTVQPTHGERELMVVAKVQFDKGSGEPRLLCRWVDSRTNKSREHLFSERELAPFDWSRPMQRTVSGSSGKTAPPGKTDTAEVEWWEINEHALANSGIDVTLGLSRVNGNQDVYQKLLFRFSESHQHFASDLKMKTVNGEWPEAQRMAHTLKGLAGTLGMIHIQHLSKDLESSIQKRDVDDLRQRVRELSEELERILKSIRENVQQPEPKNVAVTSASAGLSFRELEQSLIDHSPLALNQVSQLGIIKGHEHEMETLGQAIASYQYDKALDLLQGIKAGVAGAGTESRMK